MFPPHRPAMAVRAVRRLVPLLAFVALAGCGPQEDDGWIELGADGMPDPGRIYFHPAAIRKRGNDVYVTFRSVKESDVPVPYSDRARPLYYRTALSTQHIDCAQRRARTLGMQYFAQDGSAVEVPARLKSIIALATLDPIVEGSTMDRIWVARCWNDPSPSRP